MIEPPPTARRCGAILCAAKKWCRKFTASAPSQNSGVIAQRDLVTDSDVLFGGDGDEAVFVHDPAIERLPGRNPFDDNDGDRVVRVMQYKMNHQFPLRMK